MGGFGSGRNYRTRPLVEDRRRISAYDWLKRGHIHPEQESAAVEGQQDSLRSCPVEIALAWKESHLGGARPYFLCPGCGCRYVYLQLTKRGAYRCRKCEGLQYRSQLSGDWDRLATKLRKLKRRMGDKDWRNALTLPLFKPKHMHWETFDRLHAEAESLQRQLITRSLKCLKQYR